MSVRLCVISNAGGTGKTTVSIHLGYALSSLGISVALIDLDPQGSLTLFCGLPEPADVEQSTAIIFRESFSGNWPLVSCWRDYTDRVQVCQGGLMLTQTTQEIALHPRGAYLLADALEDYPLSQDVIIFDCPATLGPLPLAAVASATHLLIPVQPQPKSIQGSAKLLEWIYLIGRKLRLRPVPQILGFLPNQYDSKQATQRQLLESLPAKLAQMDLRCYPPIRHSAEFVNASALGLPLQIYRPLHPAIEDFQAIALEIQALVTPGSEDLV
ncbi:MAG: ParA family protein [Snowella sp.]